MKIAVLSDIHGNLTALNAVLNKLKQQNISHYIVAGDHISDCPNPNEVLDIISNLNGWVIRGNREESVLEMIDKQSEDYYKHKQLASIVWTKDELKNHNIDFIRTLDNQQSIAVPELDNIRVVHGSTDDTYEHLHSYKTERIKEVLNSIEESVLVCAHTHEQWSGKIEGKLIVNPGAVGVSFNNECAAEFAVLEWINGKWNVELQIAKYDIDELIGAYKLSGLYDKGGIWPKLVIQSISDGANRNIEFIRLAKKLAEEHQITGYQHIPNEIWELAIKEWNKT